MKQFIPSGIILEMHMDEMQDLRIDHFLLSPQLVKKLKDCGVDKDVRGWEKTSDHAPVWIEIA